MGHQFKFENLLNSQLFPSRFWEKINVWETNRDYEKSSTSLTLCQYLNANSTFYRSVLKDLVFESKRGWSWPCIYL